MENLEKKPGFPIVFDKKQQIPTLYNIEGLPTSIVIDRRGKIRFVHVGFDDDIKNSYKKEVELLLNDK